MSLRSKSGRSKEGVFSGKLNFLKNLQLSNNQLIFDPDNLDRGLLLDLINYVENPVFLDDDDEKNAEKKIIDIASNSTLTEDIVFDLPSFDNQKQDYDFLVEKLKNGVEWAKSDIKCRNCGQLTVDFYEKQTRSADESATVFYRCQQCGYRWKKI